MTPARLELYHQVAETLRWLREIAARRHQEDLGNMRALDRAYQAAIQEEHGPGKA